MHSMLRNDQYESVKAFDDDLNLIVNNATEFNGPQHPVTELGETMFAYTRGFIGKVPTLDQAQTIDENSSTQNSVGVVTVEVGLDSYRALELWSRWLYGSPMWHQEDRTDVDEDLSSLASIYRLCAGSWWSACPDHDADGINGSLDAIREIIATQHCDLGQLFLLLSRQLESTESMALKMSVDVLVYGDSAEQGYVMDWPQDLEEKHPEFFGALGLKLARRKMGKERPDLMAPCAYHIHPAGSQCEGTIREEVEGSEWN